MLLDFIFNLTNSHCSTQSDITFTPSQERSHAIITSHTRDIQQRDIPVEKEEEEHLNGGIVKGS